MHGIHPSTITAMMETRDLSDEDARYIRKHLKIGQGFAVKARDHYHRCMKRLQAHDAEKALKSARAAYGNDNVAGTMNLGAVGRV